MPPTVQNETFGKARLFAGVPKPICHCGEMAGLRALRWKHPPLLPRTASLCEHLEGPIAHRDASSAFFGLAIRYKDDSVRPIQVLNAHPVKLSFIPHSRISHHNDDVPKKL